MHRLSEIDKRIRREFVPVEQKKLVKGQPMLHRPLLVALFAARIPMLLRQSEWKWIPTE